MVWNPSCAASPGVMGLRAEAQRCVIKSPATGTWAVNVPFRPWRDKTTPEGV